MRQPRAAIATNKREDRSERIVGESAHARASQYDHSPGRSGLWIESWAADSCERQDRRSRLAGSSLSESQFRVRRWQVDSAGRRRPVGIGPCVAARDSRHGESGGVRAYRVDAADTGRRESVPAGSPDDRGAGFAVIAHTQIYETSALLSWTHSQRSPIIGSTFVARRAGIQQANNPTRISSNAITIAVIGSVTVTP